MYYEGRPVSPQPEAPGRVPSMLLSPLLVSRLYTFSCAPPPLMSIHTHLSATPWSLGARTPIQTIAILRQANTNNSCWSLKAILVCFLCLRINPSKQWVGINCTRRLTLLLTLSTTSVQKRRTPWHSQARCRKLAPFSWHLGHELGVSGAMWASLFYVPW